MHKSPERQSGLCYNHNDNHYNNHYDNNNYYHYNDPKYRKCMLIRSESKISMRPRSFLQ